MLWHSSHCKLPSSLACILRPAPMPAPLRRARPPSSLLLFLLLPFVFCRSAAAPAAPVGRVASVRPRRGPETGGTRVVLRGAGLPAFAANVSVRFGAWQRLRCERIVVTEPLAALSCELPRCVRCGAVRLSVVVDGVALRGEPVFTFDSECYGAPAEEMARRARAPLLPPRYSGAENCTVCRLAAGAALAGLGDAATHADLRTALRRVCGTPHFKSAGRVGETFCRTDLVGACVALYHADALPLIDALWGAWQTDYELGALPDEACTRIARCPSREWRRTHSHLDEWSGG